MISPLPHTLLKSNFSEFFPSDTKITIFVHTIPVCTQILIFSHPEPFLTYIFRRIIDCLHDWRQGGEEELLNGVPEGRLRLQPVAGSRSYATTRHTVHQVQVASKGGRLCVGQEDLLCVLQEGVGQGAQLAGQESPDHQLVAAVHRTIGRL